MEYKLIYANNVERLNDLINSYLKTGWKLEGKTIIISTHHEKTSNYGRQYNEIHYHQAMIKEGEIK